MGDAAALACLGYLLLAGPAAAQHMNAKDAICREAGGTADAAACLVKALSGRDEELAKLLDDVRPAIAGDQLRIFNRAQQAWTTYRQLSCDAEYALYGGGTGGPVARLACQEALTRARLKDLHDAYDWRIENHRWIIAHPAKR